MVVGLIHASYLPKDNIVPSNSHSMPRKKKQLEGCLLGTTGSGCGDSNGVSKVKEPSLACYNGDPQYMDGEQHTLFRGDPLAPLDDPLSSLTRVETFNHLCFSPFCYQVI